MGIRPGRAALAAIALALMWPSAASAARPALDATHAFTAVSGYFDSVSGSCPDNVRTGPDQTFTLLGEMWTDGGASLAARMNLGGFDSVNYTGTMGEDGTFALSGQDYIQEGVTD